MDDCRPLVGQVVDAIAEVFSDVEVFGIIMDGSTSVRTRTGIDDSVSPRSVLAGANVVFLDHNMFPKGDEVFRDWLKEVADDCRVIGISASRQGYLKEHVDNALYTLTDSEKIKKILGME